MKEKNIISEIIKLSKEIAEIWRMEIYEGCWIVSSDRVMLYHSDYAFLDGVALVFCNGRKDKNWFPIPSISDCLEKLDKLCAYWSIHSNYDDNMKPTGTVVCWGEANGETAAHEEAKTPHLAVLSALLEVLKKEG